MISDAHEGIKAVVARVFRATWQRCRVHFLRNALAHAGRSGRRVVTAFIGRPSTAHPPTLTSPPDQTNHALGAAPHNFHQPRDTTLARFVAAEV